MSAGTYVVVCGGVSVNDPEHDANPYNFLNPAARRAIQLRGQSKSVVVLLFAPPYRTRVTGQKKEYSGVTYTPAEQKDPSKRDKERFIKTLKDTGTSKGFPVVELATAGDLTAELNKRPAIAAVEYFGHSNPALIFLQYSTTGRDPRSGEVTWGVTEARSVSPARFVPGAYFWSFGCYQADIGGLAEQLRPVWGISCIGSRGKTDFTPTGTGLIFPTSAGGWVKYPAPVKDPRTGSLTNPPPVGVASPT